MNASSEKRLSAVMPELARRVRAMADALNKQGITIEVVQGLRTFAEQDALFAQGRTKPGKRVTNARGGQSNHNYGLSADVVPFVNGKPDWDAKDSVWEKIGAEAERVSLEWGGRWKSFVDRPHVQLPAPPVVRLFALYKQGGLALVWSEVEKLGVK